MDLARLEKKIKGKVLSIEKYGRRARIKRTKRAEIRKKLEADFEYGKGFKDKEKAEKKARELHGRGYSPHILTAHKETDKKVNGYTAKVKETKYFVSIPKKRVEVTRTQKARKKVGKYYEIARKKAVKAERVLGKIKRKRKIVGARREQAFRREEARREQALRKAEDARDIEEAKRYKEESIWP